jgi:hypothetical protein
MAAHKKTPWKNPKWSAHAIERVKSSFGKLCQSEGDQG